MSENILVCVAWPYANAEIHVGNIVGSHLPADIFARYQRLRGNRVLMVSGTDSHGTPITVRADTEHTTPLAVYERFHEHFLELFVKLGISFDLFTSTHTENHFKVSQDMFLALLNNGYVYREKQQMLYSETEKRFLPDRYVEGECYICHFPDARGDQCDNCGNVLDAVLLINPRSKIDGSRPVVRETEHYFIDYGKLAPAIQDYLSRGKEFWRSNVLAFTRNIVAELRGRPVTRDLDWGIPVPIEGWEGKCLYVWYEAVIGYLSASIEWARNNGHLEDWKQWWYQPKARTYYFIGKDNIPFHTVFWPGQLLGASKLYAGPNDEALNLPYDVPANEFMNMEGKKISGSRNWGVWGLDYLSRYDPDPLRYYLTVQMPESKDTDWSWGDYWRRNNDELVATWGNLVNRIVSFTARHFDGAVPHPGALDEVDTQLLAQVDLAFEPIGEQINLCKFKAALADAMALARDVNKYVDEKAPWFSIKTDRERTATTLYATLRAIDSLKVLFAPFLPFTSQRLHAMLGYSGDLFGKQIVNEYQESTRAHRGLTYDGSAIDVRWQPSALPIGQKFGAVAPLFKKLDEKIVEEERSKLGKSA
ncbi:MAG TPA: methionine--tRNA ligase [Anaerolineae bacterium]|nr:methionine--tRNA ligase [Anaerolineae bacterium]